jgi:hypothetical protein
MMSPEQQQNAEEEKTMTIRHYYALESRDAHHSTIPDGPRLVVFTSRQRRDRWVNDFVYDGYRRGLRNVIRARDAQRHFTDAVAPNTRAG